MVANEEHVALLKSLPLKTVAEEPVPLHLEVSGDAEEESNKQNVTTLIVGYIATFLMISTYCVSLALAQAMGGKTSIFELSFFRFGSTMLLGLIHMLLRQHSFRIAKRDIYKFAIGIPFNFVKCTVFFLAAEIMPVGDMDGLFAAFYIIFSSGFDLIRGNISRVSVIASALGVLGVILLCQPWQPWDTSKTPEFAPCDYLDNKSLTALPSSNQTISLDITVTDWSHSHKYTLGILYVIFAAISATVGNNALKSILKSYSVQCLLFWSGLWQAVLSAVVMLSLKYFSDGHLSFPHGAACLGLTLLFIVTIALITIFGLFAYKMLPISKAALAMPFATVSLYLLQRTLLKDFYPGHANVLEILGIVLIFCCGIISPIISMIFETKCKKENSN